MLKIRSRQQLVDYVNYGNPVKYIFFWGHQKPASGISKTCFSQWYDSPFEAEDNDFLTAEHYMMYHKALLFQDRSAAKKLLSATNPGQAKEIGREVKGFVQSIWKQHRFKIVVAGNMAKFSADSSLKEFLLGTGNRVLAEASPVDKIWGIGLAENDPDCSNPNNWKGDNLLGFALMEVRDRLSDG